MKHQVSVVSRREVQSACGQRKRESELSPISRWETGLEDCSEQLDHTCKPHHHVFRTGNDQIIAAAGEHMPSMPPHFHLPCQTEAAAVRNWRDRW